MKVIKDDSLGGVCEIKPKMGKSHHKLFEKLQGCELRQCWTSNSWEFEIVIRKLFYVFPKKEKKKFI